jgi:hypothetical protein
MAKSLEEHLYRSAPTKEEYLDPSSLKRRLQLIAHGLELHRSTSSGSVHSGGSQNKNSSGSVADETQQLQQLLQMQGNMGGGGNRNQGGLDGSSIPGMVTGNIALQPDLLAGLSVMGGNSGAAGILKSGGDSKYQDPIAAQKKKVIRQQQQRLLLLRHASKCKDGPACKTKFCGQMMTLWKHMKKCRDKNCKTSHCLSSRCVLNHYRICKSQGRTSTCEVCGPVMDQIKRQDQGEDIDSPDPLAAKPDPDLPNQAIPNLQGQASNFSQSGGGDNSGNNMQLMQQQAMQQLYQQQQQAVQQQQQQNQQGNNQGGMDGGGSMNGSMTANHNTLQALGGGNPNVGQVTDDSQNSAGSQDPQQMQQLQQAQQKLYQQQQVLKQLQKQQSQLLEQQKQLQEQQEHLKDPQTQQGQQLQQQHALLQQLQRRCQQQQALIQQELVMQMKALQQGGQPMSNNSQSSRHSQHSHHSQGSGSNDNNASSPNMQQQQQPGMNSGLQGMSQNMQGGGDMGSQNQNMQGNQLQSQMQALSQSHMQALNNNTSSNQSSSNGPQANQQAQLLQMQQALQAQQQQQQQNHQGDNQSQQGSIQSQPQPGSSSPTPKGGASQVMSSTSERSASGPNSKRRTSKGRGGAGRGGAQGGRGMGARGRGGKGKRLREIADDLLPGGAQSGKGSVGPGSKLSADAATMSALSKKRTADEISGDGDDKSSKSAKTEDDDKKDDSENKDDGDIGASLVSSMPKGDAEQHLESLHKGLHLTSRTITHKCLPIVQQLINDPFGWVFRDAVDPVVFGLPDYFEVVKNPMHLLLVKKKLENAVYTDMASFERDVKLVFENAILYNGEESEVGQLANTMMTIFEKEYKKVCEGM